MHIQKRRTTRRGALLAACALVASTLPFDVPGAQLAAAEAGTTPVETYIIPLPEEDIRDGSLSTHETVHTIISVTGAVDGTVVYYDHQRRFGRCRWSGPRTRSE